MTALVIFLFYLFFACLFSFPIWTSGHLLIPGGQEDTGLFLWNAWWSHYARTAHVPLYETRMLFHPWGVSLITHDMPLWMTIITDAAQSMGLSLVRSIHAWFLLTWTLNGFCTFLLARKITQRIAPSVVAGLFVMTHAYTLARVMENWGQFNVFALPLFLWLLQRARDQRRIASGVLAGAALAWAAACHYYFLIYAILIWLSVALWDLSPWIIRFERRPRRSAFLIGAAIAGALAAWIIVKKPMSVTLHGHFIGLESPANTLLVFWAALGLYAVSAWRMLPTSRSADLERISLRVTHATIAGASLIFISPLLLKAIPLILRGDYPRQHILWKTHLLGANLWALFSPNPLNAFWGPHVEAWFVHAELHPQEQASMIGWVCLAVVIGSGIWRASASSRRWLALAIGTTLLSMGVYLHIGSTNTWLPLPFYVTRLLPLLENVRVPERWMAVGATAWAVVLALALIRLAVQRGWRLNRLCLIAAGLVLVENWPGIPFVELPAPSPIFARLRQEPEGAVMTLPFYVGDSSVGAGAALPGPYPFLCEPLHAQTQHEKPIAGGYIGRIPRRLMQAYTRDPYWHRLIQREEGGIPDVTDPTPAEVRHAIQEAGIRYCLIYPAFIDATTLAFARRTLPLERIASDGNVELDRISD